MNQQPLAVSTSVGITDAGMTGLATSEGTDNHVHDLVGWNRGSMRIPRTRVTSKIFSTNL